MAATQDELIGVVIGVSASAVIALASAVVAWLRWRQRVPKDE